ncbi:RNA polymerase sigma factor RpoH [Acetobacteraceae bacterium]|nr:RNA polymerase sigma factor RpoH [Acetobacteraceae bacterium]
MTNRTLPVLTPEGSLNQYLQDIRKYPILTPEEEKDLAQRWRRDKEQDAAYRLVTSHLRRVAKIARDYHRIYGLPISELISEGNIGIMQAIQRFDPDNDKQARLSTYATWWIKAAIQEYILHSWSLVKMGTTAAQKKLFFNLRKEKRKLLAYGDGDLQPEQVSYIARQLGVPEQEVISMNRRLAGPERSLNAPLQSHDGESGQWQDWLVDETPSQEEIYAEEEEYNERKGLLNEALMTLNERERHIVQERRLKEEPQTLEELSHHYGVSRERIRQIEARALEKIQKVMMNKVAEQRKAQEDLPALGTSS